MADFGEIEVQDVTGRRKTVFNDCISKCMAKGWRSNTEQR